MDIIEKFKQSTDYQRSNVCASCAYLLFTVAQAYVEENIEILDKYNLYHYNLKHDAKELVKKFDMYDKSFRKMIIKGKEENICNDYEELAKHIKEYVEKLV